MGRNHSCCERAGTVIYECSVVCRRHGLGGILPGLSGYPVDGNSEYIKVKDTEKCPQSLQTTVHDG